MVVIFFGTPQFAVPTLDALLASSHSVVAVVTQPDRPRGRGQRTTDAPVKAHALAAAIPVLQPTSLKDPAVVADPAYGCKFSRAPRADDSATLRSNRTTLVPACPAGSASPNF